MPYWCKGHPLKHPLDILVKNYHQNEVPTQPFQNTKHQWGSVSTQQHKTVSGSHDCVMHCYHNNSAIIVLTPYPDKCRYIKTITLSLVLKCCRVIRLMVMVRKKHWNTLNISCNLAPLKVQMYLSIHIKPNRQIILCIFAFCFRRLLSSSFWKMTAG